MNIIKINPITDQGWLRFIGSHPQATIFHHPSWLKVLNSQYKFTVFAICIKDDNDIIRSGIPFCEVDSIIGYKKWISLPFTDHCEFLFHDIGDVKIMLDYLVNNYRRFGVRNIEIRSRIQGQHEFKELTDVVIHKIELNGNPEKIYSQFKLSHVRGIRKAIKNDLVVEKSKSKSGLDEFYKLHLCTRKRLGIPIQPKSYFYHLHEQLINNDFAFVLLAKNEKNVISASVFLDYGNYFVFKYGASDSRYHYLRPNNLIFWTAIKEACLRGFKCFDFGRTNLVQSGLRRFKSGWGAEETPLHYSFYPHVPKNNLFNYMKDKMVTPIIKRSPKVFCRIAGELLYKYFP